MIKETAMGLDNSGKPDGLRDKVCGGCCRCCSQGGAEEGLLLHCVLPSQIAEHFKYCNCWHKDADAIQQSESSHVCRSAGTCAASSSSELALRRVRLLRGQPTQQSGQNFTARPLGNHTLSWAVRV